MSKGILQVHPPICDCPGCRISSPVGEKGPKHPGRPKKGSGAGHIFTMLCSAKHVVHGNRGRLADKRTGALPVASALKQEPTLSFSTSDGDSDGRSPTGGRQRGLKQEDDSHIPIMRRRVHTHWDVNISFRETSCSQDSNLPTLISSVHRSRHLVMPEHPSRCDFQRGSVELGLGPTGDLLGKRLGCSPFITSDCSSEKKARSESPQETLLLPDLGPSMAPEDHYRRLVSALSEASPFEDPQRLYHLGLPSHDLLRVRQEVAAAALRSPGTLEVHLPPSLGQRRKQVLPQPREGAPASAAPSFSERWAPALSRPHSASARPRAALDTTGEDWAQDGSEEERSKDSDGEDPEMAMAAAAGAGPAPGQGPGGSTSAEGRGLLPAPALPLGFPYYTGAVGGLFTEGEAAAPEDISKWSVEDVCSFVGGLPGCGEYARVFREQGIDGETLPLLTEEHLLTTMGLKLGPALKIRAQVAKRLGRIFYMASVPVALPLQPSLRGPEQLSPGQQPLSPATPTSPYGSPYGGAHPHAGRASPKQENGSAAVALLPGASDPSQPLC
ncbi:PREDICTED: sterile alpha motif domain-containing protein 11 [Dipodomys ordii]|uniref:Sterile alpha motif domain-containing protein 11 n=1 Tax=Dipodomys ordii TaxID=10020 RepID=A0A1S3EY82_DIPOR|nr:PREDICTED: sterile alpha motif domain-containing protein 11 [Dipodomys ordii]